MTLLYYFFDLTSFFVEARVEILTNLLLVFWSIWKHQNSISKLSDHYPAAFYILWSSFSDLLRRKSLPFCVIEPASIHFPGIASNFRQIYTLITATYVKCLILYTRGELGVKIGLNLVLRKSRKLLFMFLVLCYIVFILCVVVYGVSKYMIVARAFHFSFTQFVLLLARGVSSLIMQN